MPARGTPLEVDVKRLTLQVAFVSIRELRRIFMRRRGIAFVLFGLLVGTPTIGLSDEDRSPVAVTAMVAVRSAQLPSPWPGDAAAMILVGSALIGLAAAIRRTT